MSEIAKALAAAQSEMANATMNKENPHFKSKYADLSVIRDAVMPALNKNGIAVVQLPTLTATGFVLITQLRHTSGETIEAIYPLPQNGRPQEIGSAITYARRYSLAAICGISAEEDDDGNRAEDGAKKAPPPPPRGMTAPPPKTPPPSGGPRLLEVSTNPDGTHKWGEWGQQIAAAIKSAPTIDAVNAWMRENSMPLANLRQASDKMHTRISAIAAERIAELS